MKINKLVITLRIVMEDEIEVKRIGEVGDKVIWDVMGTKFEVDSRYEILDPLGQGAYGFVVAARDLEPEDPSNDLVAIKKI